VIRVAVIGGGIAGASVAYELAERAEVVVLEAEQVCGYHTTGRSAALYTECYGDRIVRSLAGSGRGFLEDPPPGFTDSPLVAPMAMMLVGTADQAKRLVGDFDEYRETVPSLRMLDTAEATALCSVLDPAVIDGAIFEPHARSIDVHALHLAYQQGARHRGAKIRTSTPVTALENSDGWTIRTGDDTVHADVVVNASGAWCDKVGAMAGAAPIGLRALRRTAFIARAPAGTEPHGWPMVLDVGEQFYFRPEGGDRILVSPADETAMEPCDVRHEELDVAVGTERIEAVTTMRIRSVESAWAGLRSFVSDRRPVNGWDPSIPNFYWLAGQGGSGIKTSPGMSRFAASMILDGVPPGDLVDVGVDEQDLAVARLDSGAAVH